MDRSNNQNLRLTLNGSVVETDVLSSRTLAEFLREEQGLTGTHLGCEHGICGACTVLVDGRPARACLMLAVQADGAIVETVESLRTGSELGPIQQAMWDSHAFQCAFCAPGFLMTTKALLASNPSPTRAEIREELAGNLCRCTGYGSIIAGIEAAIASAKEASRA